VGHHEPIDVVLSALGRRYELHGCRQPGHQQFHDHRCYAYGCGYAQPGDCPARLDRGGERHGKVYGRGASLAAPSGTVKFTAATGSFGTKSCSTSGDAMTCTVKYKPSGTLAAGTYSNYVTASITAAGSYKAASGSATLTVTP